MLFSASPSPPQLRAGILVVALSDLGELLAVFVAKVLRDDDFELSEQIAWLAGT
jgi:hypothetical protein